MASEQFYEKNNKLSDFKKIFNQVSKKFKCLRKNLNF